MEFTQLMRRFDLIQREVQTLLPPQAARVHAVPGAAEPSRAMRGVGATVPEAGPWLHDCLTEVMKTLAVKPINYEKVPGGTTGVR